MTQTGVTDDELSGSEAIMTTRPTILVIDDETAIRGLFQEALEEWGYVVDTAPTGQAGLELFQRRSYDVVLTDYLMPGISGFEVALTVQRDHPGTAVILITGSAADEQLAAARQLNITVLCKPVPLEELKVAVGRAAGAP